MEKQLTPTLTQQELLALLKESQAANKQLRELVEQLKQQLDNLQRMVFGQKSERQKKPRADKDNNDSDEQSLTTAKANTPANNNAKHGRGKLPAKLPRKVIKHAINENEQRCTNCQGKLQCIGKDVSEQLEFIPAQLYVLEHRRYKYNCRCCHRILMAPMPEQPIDKGLAGPGLLAETLISKYQEHMPLYRLERRYTRLGHSIASTTLSDWVMQCAQRLSPIVEAMQAEMLMRSPKIHSDDTTIPVLAPNKTHTGRLWVYIGGGGHAPIAVVYRYTKTRRGAEPQQFLKCYKGYLQADAYAGYDGCYSSGDIIEVACWAHARRKYVDALNYVDEDCVAQTAIETIAKLYAIEKKVKSMADEARFYYRRKFAQPILKKFYRWLRWQQSLALPKTPVGKAINYSLNHWQALNNYLRDGVLNIDNNLAERAMKSVVLGRKNYLFAGSHNGAQAAATLYSLIETCKLLGINTFDYLTNVLRRLPTTLNSNINQLIPYNWKPVN